MNVEAKTRLSQLRQILSSGHVTPENVDLVKGMIAETERALGIKRFWL